MKTVSYPFEKAKTEPPTPPMSPAQIAEAEAREEYRAEVAAAREAWEQSAVDAWEKSEAVRRSKFIDAFKSDYPWSSERPLYKYESWQPSAILRDRLAPSERLSKLVDAGEFREFLKCKLVRAGGSASVADVKSWLREVGFPVDGTEVLKPSEMEAERLARKGRVNVQFGTGLSPDLMDLLLHTRMLAVDLKGVHFEHWHECSDKSSW